MINLSSTLQRELIVRHNNFDTQKTHIEFQDWINYQELAFDCLSLGEVVSLLECLQKEAATTEDMSDYYSSILLTKTKKQRMIAKWNNIITVAHIKFFIRNAKNELTRLVHSNNHTVKLN